MYPQHRNGSDPSVTQQLRWRWYLAHPEATRGKQEFVQSLTQRPDLGIEIQERWDVWRIGILIGILIAASLMVGVSYSIRTGDVSSGFAIAGTSQTVINVRQD